VNLRIHNLLGLGVSVGMALATVIISTAIILAGDPRTNNPNPEPPPATNAARRMPPRPQRPPVPQQLQSAEATNAPAAAPTTSPKAIGIVLYEVYAVQTGPSTPPLLVVDPRYLHDLTNHYRHQFIPVLRLEEQ
jgi:hypothetical protein